MSIDESSGRTPKMENPYDLLEGLEGDTLQKARTLFNLAGVFHQESGYTFEKTSGTLYEDWSKVEIYDPETQELVGTVSHPNLVWEYLNLGYSPFVAGKTYRYTVTVAVSDLDTLFKLRTILLENVQKRGKSAGQEYMAFVSTTGTVLTTNEILKLVRRALK